jgi:hypothetical protein
MKTSFGGGWVSTTYDEITSTVLYLSIPLPSFHRKEGRGIGGKFTLGSSAKNI